MKTRRSQMWRYVCIAIMSVVFLAQQDCFFRGGKTNSPVEPAPNVSIAVLPLNVREQPQVPKGGAQAAGSHRSNQVPAGSPARRPPEGEPELQSLAIAGALAATDVLQGVPGIEPVPLWRTLHAASSILNSTRWVTPSMAAELANMLSVRWTMMGEISPAPEGFNLIIDFIPAKSAVFPFRYQKVLRRELLSQSLNEALEEFLRYAGHPVPQLKTLNREGNWSDLSRLAEAVDREYGWFLPPAPGSAQTTYAGLVTREPRLANLLFDPDRYGVTTAPAVTEPAKPGTVIGAGQVARPAPVLSNATNDSPDREPPKQVASQPSYSSAGVPQNSKWTPLTASPVLSLQPEQQPHTGQDSPTVRGRTSSMPFAPNAGYQRESGVTVLPPAPGARYVLQLFASADEKEAKQVAQKLLQEGVTAKISTVGAGRETFYRVSGGTYDSPVAASAAGEALIALRMANEYWIRTESAPVAPASQSQAAEPQRGAGAAGSTAGAFQIQVFASTDRQKADEFAEKLRQISLQAQVEPFMLAGKGEYYRVRLTGYRSREEAVAVAEKLRAEGRIREYWIVS